LRGKSRVTIGILAVAMCFQSAAFAAKADPESARRQLALHYFRGVINFEAGRYQEAMDEFRAVADVDPYYKDTQKYISRLDRYRAELLDPKDGRDYDTKGVDLYFLGKHYYEKGDYDRAMEAFKAILDKAPGDKFALYYKQLIEAASPKYKRVAGVAPKSEADEIAVLQKEVSYIKEDVDDKEDSEAFLQERAQARAERDEIIRSKERQLDRQEDILEEERKDYLAQASLAKRAEKVAKESEKWRRMKEKLSSRQPGIPADLTEFPAYQNNGEKYYKSMKESLRESRWNSAGLNAIKSALYYCDSLLIYYYGIKSSYPEHENIARLMAEYIHRADLDENIIRLRAILNMKIIIEGEDRPLTRSEAIFLAEKAERLIQWCRSILP